MNYWIYPVNCRLVKKAFLKFWVLSIRLQCHTDLAKSSYQQPHCVATAKVFYELWVWRIPDVCSQSHHITTNNPKVNIINYYYGNTWLIINWHDNERIWRLVHMLKVDDTWGITSQDGRILVKRQQRRSLPPQRQRQDFCALAAVRGNLANIYHYDIANSAPRRRFARETVSCQRRTTTDGWKTAPPPPTRRRQDETDVAFPLFHLGGRGARFAVDLCLICIKYDPHLPEEVHARLTRREA